MSDAKPKTCGDCRHTEVAGEKLVWCYGAPPTVISVVPKENGQRTINSQQPLLHADDRACAVFKVKAKPPK